MFPMASLVSTIHIHSGLYSLNTSSVPSNVENRIKNNPKNFRRVREPCVLLGKAVDKACLEGDFGCSIEFAVDIQLVMLGRR